MRSSALARIAGISGDRRQLCHAVPTLHLDAAHSVLHRAWDHGLSRDHRAPHGGRRRVQWHVLGLQPCPAQPLVESPDAPRQRSRFRYVHGRSSRTGRLPAIRSALRWAWGIITVGAITAGLAAIWFTSLQVFAVGHLCAYCLAAHACGLALLVAIVWKAPLGARMTAKLSGLSVLGAGALIAAQLLAAPPQTYKIEHFPAPAPAVKNASVPAATTTAPKANRPEKSPAPEVFEPPSGE